jgi:hypothetical protein
MALSGDQLKALIRLKGTADELLVSAREVRGRRVEQAKVGDQVGAVVRRVRGMLEESPELLEEFNDVVVEPKGPKVSLALATSSSGKPAGNRWK